jgi:MFS family permease
MTAFTVDFLKTQEGLSESKILMIVAVSFIGGLASLWIMGSRFDRWGSKPVLTFCFVAWLVVLAGWILISSRLIPPGVFLVLLLSAAMGLLAAMVQMANTRLAMSVIPVMGRNHFFALYSVANNVILGIAPVGWGLAIDMVGTRQPVFLGITWNRFTIFFAGACAAFTVALVLARRLVEPQAAGLNQMLKELIVETPLRFWVRFWPRG